MSSSYTTTNGRSVRGATEGEFLSTGDEMAAVHSELVAFIRRRVTAAEASGAVVAMSGGIDSTLTAMLTTEALGSDRVLGLGLPCNIPDSDHMADARTIAEGLGIEFREIPLQPVLDMFEDVVAPSISARVSQRVIGNVVSRLRMSCAYYAANTRSRLVVGTANRSELLLGYFTKHGDGGADLNPLGELYKTEVRSLAESVGVPMRIINTPPTAGLWAGQTDEDDLGAPYDVIDRLLQRFTAHAESIETAAETVGVDPSLAERIAERYVDSAHKRSVPPTPGITGRVDGQPADARPFTERPATDPDPSD